MENAQDTNNAAGGRSRSTDVLGEAAPCPFCGKAETLEIITGAELMDEDQEFYQHSASYSVVCNAANPNGKGGCGAMGGFCDTEEAALARWNTRASGWIDAAQRLPEPYRIVLIWHRDLPGFVGPIMAFHTGKAWHDDVMKPALAATHWMPRPATPNNN